MRKKIFFFISLAMLCAVLWGWYLYQKPRNSTADLPSVARVESDSLYQNFAKDETGANKKYLGKIITVDGVITDVVKTDSTCNVMLKVNDAAALGVINCNMDFKNNRLSTKNINKLVIIKGRCEGFLMDVILTDCQLENEEK